MIQYSIVLFNAAVYLYSLFLINLCLLSLHLCALHWLLRVLKVQRERMCKWTLEWITQMISEVLSGCKVVISHTQNVDVLHFILFLHLLWIIKAPKTHLPVFTVTQCICLQLSLLFKSPLPYIICNDQCFLLSCLLYSTEYKSKLCWARRNLAAFKHC